MVLAARAAGLEYIAITDHSKALAMANGLDETRALAHAARIRELDGRIDGIRVLAGIECDILPDGSLDLADDCLAAARPRRRVGALGASGRKKRRSPRGCCAPSSTRWVDIIAHPTSRMLLRREPSRLNLERVIAGGRRATVSRSRSTARSIASICPTSTPGSRASAACSW